MMNEMDNLPKNLNIDEFYYMVSELVSMRRRKGITTTEVAVACNVTTQTVRNFDNLFCFNAQVLGWYLQLGIATDVTLTHMLLTNSYNWEG